MLLTAHIIGMYAVLLCFLPSIYLIRFGQVSAMYKKIFHGTLQVIGAMILIASLGASFLIPANDVQTQVQRAAGAVILAVGVPTIFATRTNRLKRYHRATGWAVVFILCFYTIYISFLHEGMSFVIASIIICVAYTVLVSLAYGLRRTTIADFVHRNADGTYAITRCASNVVPVGAGWSYYLNKRIREDSDVSMSKLSGRYTRDTWGAGTSIGRVQELLARENKTLASHPSIYGASLGGWLFTNAHGSGGTIPHETFGNVVVLDTESCTIRKVKHTFFNTQRSIEEQRQYIILEVELKPVKNITCYRQAYDIRSEADCQQFIEKETLLRMIFVDSGQALCFEWTKAIGDDTRRYRFTDAFIPPWLATLLPSGVARCVPRKWWTKETTLMEANRFAPDPPYWTGLVARCYTNFEVYIRYTLTPRVLLQLCQGLHHLFRREGRCEIRYHMHTVFLDVAMRGTHTMAFFRLIRDTFGFCVPMHLHKGKYQASFPSVSRRSV